MSQTKTRVRGRAGNGLMLTSVLLGFITAGLAFGWLNQVRSEERGAAAHAAGATKPVLVAQQDIAAGTRLTASMFKWQDVPESLVLSGALTSDGEVAGRVTLYPIAQGEQLLAVRLVGASEPSRNGLAYSVPDGMRAVSMPVSEVSAAGGLIVPGDRVDIIVSTEYGSLFGPFDQVAKRVDGYDPRTHKVVVTALQDVLVLAVGQTITPAQTEERDVATLRSDDASPQPKATSVTVAVTPDDAQAIFMAIKSGSIGLALRPYGDTGRASVQPALSLPSRQTASASAVPVTGR